MAERKFSDEELMELKRADMLRHLIKQEGWAEFEGLVNQKLRSYQQKLMVDPTESGTMFDSRTEDWIKGAMYGLMYMRDLPNVIIAAMEQLRAERKGE